MKRTNVILVVATVLVVSLVGGFTFAQTNNNVSGNMMLQQRSNINDSQGNHCGNSEEMIQVMKDNGFAETAAFIEIGDYEGMNEWMKNLTDEEYNKMLEVMKDNDYGNMVNMMESMGKEDMLKMHNSMMGVKGSMMNMMRLNN